MGRVGAPRDLNLNFSQARVSTRRLRVTSRIQLAQPIQPIPREAMAGSSKPTEKRQASLTSFFTINGLGKRPTTTSTESSSASPAPEPAAKRRLRESTDSGNENTGRAAKRAKSSAGAGAGANGESSRAPAKATSPGVPVAPDSLVPSRTERYSYSAGRPSIDASAGRNEDDDDGATKRKKEELHRKFVKKLGHPDSLSRFRRRDFPAESESPGLEVDDEEGGGDVDEDEPAAPAKTARKKGAKTGKLTPMEIQFLDIKRKHMDTILVVEVGYKFRFFGEDARIAAKELSIVCIPGKFRYDERMCTPDASTLSGAC